MSASQQKRNRELHAQNERLERERDAAQREAASWESTACETTKRAEKAEADAAAMRASLEKADRHLQREVSNCAGWSGQILAAAQTVRSAARSRSSIAAPAVVERAEQDNEFAGTVRFSRLLRACQSLSRRWREERAEIQKWKDATVAGMKHGVREHIQEEQYLRDRVAELEGALRGLECYTRHVVGTIKHSSVAPCECPMCIARALLPAPANCVGGTCCDDGQCGCACHDAAPAKEEP